MSRKAKILSTNKKETAATHNSSIMDMNSLHRQSVFSQDIDINVCAKDSLENSIAEYTNNTIEVLCLNAGLA
jgi:hypothetical protein